MEDKYMSGADLDQAFAALPGFLSLIETSKRLSLNREIYLLERDELKAVVDAFKKDCHTALHGYSLDGSAPSRHVIEKVLNGVDDRDGSWEFQPYIR